MQIKQHPGVTMERITQADPVPSWLIRNQDSSWPGWGHTGQAHAAWSHESCWPVLTTVAVPSLKWHFLLSSSLTNQL